MDLDGQVREIKDKRLKAEIAEGVLRALPDWFGIEESIVEYVQQCQDMPFWAACVQGRPVGFLALRRHNSYTAEIYCMGIRQEFHRHGLGTALVAACEAACVEQHLQFLTVKTLDESRPDQGYANTRQFYLAAGFKPLEVFPTLWGEENPCLFMVKSLENDTRRP